MVSTRAPADLLEGTPYAAESVLGEGGMGIVIEAVHKKQGHRVALKLLHAHLAEEKGLVDRLRVEGALLAALESPHLVRVSDAGITPRGDVFIVMERLFGRSLAQELEARGAIPWEETTYYVRHALRGLSVVHKAGVVHRDIKPANLFLVDGGERRNCKLLDFGVAKIIDGPARAFDLPVMQPTAPGMIVGSPRYMSPEQARGEPADPRSDVYSMGAVLYALLAGRGPFDDKKGFADYCQAHVFQAPPSLTELAKDTIPLELESIVMKALAKKPEERFQTAEAFLKALDDLAAGELRARELLAAQERPRADVHRTDTPQRVSPIEAKAETPLALSLRATLFACGFAAGLIVALLTLFALNWPH